MTIDFSPQEEATLAEAARQAGIAPADLVRKVVQEHLPPVTATENADPTLALIASWIAQAPTDPDAVREAEQDLADFQRAMNQPRKDAGAPALPGGYLNSIV